MTGIYTYQVYNGYFVGGGTETIYTVPDGKFLVLTDVDMQSDYTDVGQSLQLSIGSAGIILDISAATGLFYLPWRGRQAMNAGDVLSLSYNSAYVSVAATGYLLDILS
jgi:hypothetical protein